ncbi:MAG: GIY-YIG nuclease family protein [Polyangiaceae bacterium]
MTESLAELQVLVVDCQTTGATPALGSVLELGWGIACAADPTRDHAEAHWIVLPEGERVSATVRQLTGFREELLAEALTPEQAFERLHAQIATPSMPTAIHFARFELSFLRDWWQRFDASAPFPIDAVCVHAIACRLYPDLARRNLRALAGFLGHGLHLERRALGHVQATAFIWRKLSQELDARGVRSWSELTEWLATAEKPAAARKRSYPMPKARYLSLPDAPGIYRMLRSNGDVLYVGKATSLKKRVASHFTKQRGATERALEMLTQVHQVEFTATATALEAALLETELIKELAPPYNVQLVQGERDAWFAAHDFSDYARTPDEWHQLGPLPSRFSVRCLRAVTELHEGASVTPLLRAGAVGAPLAFAPDDASFSAGWALFCERHSHRTSGSARLCTLRAARTLRLSMADAEADDPSEPAPETSERSWDPERVCRHLERSLAGAYQALRRAGFLCLLANSTVYFREPKLETGRSLRFEAARLVASREVASSVQLDSPARASRLAARQAFDAARYDQLRILATELKRIQRDGGEVAVRVSKTRVLDGTRLRNILRVV